MFRRLAAVLSSDLVRIALAGAAVSMGISVLTKIAEERQQLLAALDSEIAARLARLNEMDTEPVIYPAPEDLDPLGRGTDSPIGDQLAEEYDPR